MKIPTLNLAQYPPFTLFGLFWIGLGWLGLILTLFGIFYAPILAVYFFAAGSALLFVLGRSWRTLRISRSFWTVLLFSLLAIGIFSYYSTPSIFSGRDQGSLSEAAIRLTQNHQLKFSSLASQEFFQIYGPGKALNFPGFNYTTDGQLITQFPLGYIAWLASFYAFLGLGGLVAANGVTLLLFILSFYLIARQYLRTSSALLAWGALLSTFVFSWFFKFTLSENLAWMLIWFGLYEFILFSRSASRFHLSAFLLSFSLLIFARVEALSFLLMAALIIFRQQRQQKNILATVFDKKIIGLLGGIVALYVINLIVNLQFFITLAKGALKPFLSLGRDLAATGGLSMFLYVLRIFSTYALLSFLVFGLIGVFFFLKNKKYTWLVPFALVLPAFFYLLQPSISTDHPWMLRRFVFAVIPVTILYAFWFLDHFLKKRASFYIIAAFLILTNLLIAFPFLTFAPAQKLLPQVREISQNFTASDLVLVDRDATGDGWTMLTGPLSFLMDKQAVYFFNPKDLAKINREKFSNIYFIIPDNSLAFYEEAGLLTRLTPVKDYTLETNALELIMADENGTLPGTQLPIQKDILVTGKIYLLN